MSNFTDQELETVVSSYVRGETKTRRADLGQLDVSYAFNEVKQFIASTLVHDPSAIFYLLSLAANKVRQDITQALVYLDDIKTAIEEMGRSTVKVTNTNLLEDAAAALLEVDRLLNDKNVIVQRGISRFSSALQRFTSSSLTPNIREETGLGFPNTYKVVRPPQKAQEVISTNISLLRDLHIIILEEVNQLSNAMEEFIAENLTLTAIQTSVNSVRTDLRKLKNEFDAASTDDEAISLTKDAYLRITAGEAVITNLSEISDPREPRMQGLTTTSDRAQAAFGSDSIGTPAEVILTRSAPWLISPTSNQIILAVDGGSDITINLPVDEIANIEGSKDEPFDIHTAQAANITSSSSGPYTTPAAPNNVFDVYVDGVGYRVTLTPGAISTSALAVLINGATKIDSSPGTFDDVATATDSGGYIKLTHDTIGIGDIVIGEQDALNTALGFVSGQDSDDLSSTRGIFANNVIKFLVNYDIEVEAILTVGAARTASQIAADITSIYIDAAAVTIPVLPSGSITVVQVKSKVYGASGAISFYPTTSVHEATMDTLGFYEIQADRGGNIELYNVVEAINNDAPSVDVVITETEQQYGIDGEARKVSSVYYLDVGPIGTIDTLKVEVGDSLQIEFGQNVGWYRVVAITTLDGGTRDAIQVERPFPTVTVPQSEGQIWSVHKRIFTLKSKTTGLLSKLEIKAGSANTELGLSVDTLYGYVSGVKVLEAGKSLSFLRNDVRANDLIIIGSGGSITSHTVTNITEDGYQIEVTPYVKNDVISQLYTIKGEGNVAYELFIDDLESALIDLSNGHFSTNILFLERTLNPLLVNKNPSAALIADAQTVADDLTDIYSNLEQMLTAFVVTPVNRIDSLLNMLIERGLDRAYDLLLLGRIQDFFDLTKDSASYAGNVLEAMRLVTQNDLPLSRNSYGEHVDSRLIASTSDPDANFDYSDQDYESSFVETDDILDLDEENIFLEEVII